MTEISLSTKEHNMHAHRRILTIVVCLMSYSTVWICAQPRYKPRHDFLDACAALTRPCLVNINSTSNHGVLRPHEPLNT
jgi:hypothetical protein